MFRRHAQIEDDFIKLTKNILPQQMQGSSLDALVRAIASAHAREVGDLYAYIESRLGPAPVAKDQYNPATGQIESACRTLAGLHYWVDDEDLLDRQNCVHCHNVRKKP